MNILGEMTDILLEHEGTLDKYVGDEIAAFFGAPFYYSDHADRACQVALKMQQRLAELRQKWKKEGKPELFVRIGVNTGPIVVGNLGSKNRMSYGMNGDAVNLAARLEGANKVYGTYTMISEATLEQAGDWIEVRELDLIQVIGRATPVKIYEIMGEKGKVDPIMLQVAEHYSKGYQAYRAQDWEIAIQQFNNALKINNEKIDYPSKILLERCLIYINNSPPKGWKGIHIMTSK